MKSNAFCGKKQLNYRNQGQGTHITKMGADSSAKNTTNTSKFAQNVFGRSAQLAQKIGTLFKKKASLGARSL